MTSAANTSPKAGRAFLLEGRAPVGCGDIARRGGEAQPLHDLAKRAAQHEPNGLRRRRFRASRAGYAGAVKEAVNKERSGPLFPITL
jgi:hypothetical protein